MFAVVLLCICCFVYLSHVYRKKVAHTSIQELRQMVFDMDSDVKPAGIDKRTGHEQDFKKLGFQVLPSTFICHFYSPSILVQCSSQTIC